MNKETTGYYLKGLANYERRNYEEAFAYLTNAAYLEHPYAQNLLGVLYMEGWGCTQDFSQALMWFKKSAAQNVPEAQENLALWYKTQFGDTPPQLDKALSWANKAVQNGSVYAIRLRNAILREIEQFKSIQNYHI